MSSPWAAFRSLPSNPSNLLRSRQSYNDDSNFSNMPPKTYRRNCNCDVRLSAKCQLWKQIDFDFNGTSVLFSICPTSFANKHASAVGVTLCTNQYLKHFWVKKSWSKKSPESLIIFDTNGTRGIPPNDHESDYCESHIFVPHFILEHKMQTKIQLKYLDPASPWRSLLEDTYAIWGADISTL